MTMKCIQFMFLVVCIMHTIVEGGDHAGVPEEDSTQVFIPEVEAVRTCLKSGASEGTILAALLRLIQLNITPVGAVEREIPEAETVKRIARTLGTNLILPGLSFLLEKQAEEAEREANGFMTPLYNNAANEEAEWE